jgi:hypothetical protein
VLHLGDRALLVIAVRLPAAPQADQPDEHVGFLRLLAAQLHRTCVLRAEILLPHAVKQARAHQPLVNRLAMLREIHRGRA